MNIGLSHRNFLAAFAVILLGLQATSAQGPAPIETFEGRKHLSNSIETQIRELSRSLNDAERRWRSEFSGTITDRSGTPVAESEILRPVTAYKTEFRRQADYASELSEQALKGEIRGNDYGQQIDQVLETLIVSIWSVYLDEAELSIRKYQQRYDEESGQLQQQWSGKIAAIAEDHNPMTPGFDQATNSARREIAAEEQLLRDNTQRYLDRIASVLASRRADLIGRIEGWVMEAVALQRTDFSFRFDELIETEFEVASSDELNLFVIESKLRVFVESHEILASPVVLTEQPSRLKLDIANAIAQLAEEPAPPGIVRYPVRTAALLTYIGGISVERPDPANPRGPWHRRLPGELAESYGMDQRLLMIHGENFLSISNGDARIESLNPKVTYEVLEVGPNDWADHVDSEYLRAWQEHWIRLTATLRTAEEKQALSRIDKVLVVATLAPGTLSGLQKLKVNGIPGEWFLRQGNVTANMRFVRERAPGPDLGAMLAEEDVDVLHHFFSHDRVAVQVELSHGVGANELPDIPVVLTVLDEVLPAGGKLQLPARPVAGSNTLFQTETIRPLAVNQSSPPPIAGVLDSRIGQGLTVTGIVARTAPVTLRQPAAAQFVLTPAKIGSLWKDAVHEAVDIANNLSVFDRFDADDPVIALGRRLNGEGGRIELHDYEAILPVPVTEFEKRHVTHDGDRITVTIGDLAAMIVLRNTFIEETQKAYDQYLHIAGTISDDPFALRAYYESLRPLIADGSSPIQNVKVTPPAGRTVGEELGLLDLGIPFSQAYDENYLNGAFSTYGGRIDWLNKATNEALHRYMDAAYDAINEAELTRSQDLDEIVGLLNLVSVGFRPVAIRARPNLVRLSTDASSPRRWLPDEHARRYINGVRTKGQRYRANEELSDAEFNIALAATAVLTFGAAAVGGPVLAMEAVLAGEFVFHEVPEHYRRQREYQFALGAAAVIGPERVRLAESQTMPEGWLYLEAIGGLIGLRADFLMLAARSPTTRLIPSALQSLEKVEGGGMQAFIRLSTEEQAQLAGFVHSSRVASLTDRRSLTSLQRRAADLYEEGLNDVAFARQADAIGRMRAGAVPGGPGIEAPLRSGRIFEPPQGFDPNLGAPPSLAVGHELPELGARIHREIGVGMHARVYEVVDMQGQVLDKVVKVYHDVPAGRDSIRRVLYGADLLEQKGIGQLPIESYRLDAHPPFTVQQKLPDDAATYSVVFEELPIEGASKFKGSVLGVKEFSRFDPETEQTLLQQLPKPQQRALLELFTDLSRVESGKPTLYLEDAHLENFFFRQVGENRWQAGILDQDRLLPWEMGTPPDDHVMRQVFDDAISRVESLPYTPEHGIFSLSPPNLPNPGDGVRFWSLDHGFPNAHFFMEKMLEHKRYVYYDRVADVWRSRLLDMDTVDEYFPGIRSRVDYDYAGEALRQADSGGPSGPARAASTPGDASSVETPFARPRDDGFSAEGETRVMESPRNTPPEVPPGFRDADTQVMQPGDPTFREARTEAIESGDSAIRSAETEIEESGGSAFRSAETEVESASPSAVSRVADDNVLNDIPTVITEHDPKAMETARLSFRVDTIARKMARMSRVDPATAPVGDLDPMAVFEVNARIWAREFENDEWALVLASWYTEVPADRLVAVSGLSERRVARIIDQYLAVESRYGSAGAELRNPAERASRIRQYLGDATPSEYVQRAQ